MKTSSDSIITANSGTDCSGICGVAPDTYSSDATDITGLWGPDRTTFTMKNPAHYPTFNSITDNPTIGDERNFVRVKQANPDKTDLANEIEVVPGRRYLVYIYYHNNASATFNDSAHDHFGVAIHTRLSSTFPETLLPNSKGAVTATITANNANPASVWGKAYLTTSDRGVHLCYVEGSAKIYNDWGVNKSILSSSLFTEEGVLLGLNELNGVIPGCEAYHGIVTYILEASNIEADILNCKEGSANNVAFN